MDNGIFVPDYGLTKYSDVSGKFFLGFPALIIGMVGKNIPWFLFGMVLSIWGLYEWVSYPKTIVFNERGMIVKRMFLPDLTFNYRELNGIGTTAISFGSKNIPLGEIRNLNDLKKILDELVNNGIIRLEQISGKTSSNQTSASSSCISSAISILVFGAVFVYLGVFQFDFQENVKNIFMTVLLIELVFGYSFTTINKNKYKVKK